MNYMLDTSVINWLVDGTINGTMLPSDGKFFATHVQIDEINKTSDEERRARLYLTLASSLSGLLQTETTVRDVSRWDFSKQGDGSLYNAVKSELDALNGSRQNNVRDALIAEVAIVNSMGLLTADRDLASAAMSHGGQVTLFEKPRS